MAIKKCTAVENLIKEKQNKEYSCHFLLFIAGNEMNSTRAENNLQYICDKYFNEDVKIDVIDVLDDFKTALANKIFITPALIIEKPKPTVTIYGTLNDKDKILAVLRTKEVID